MLLLPVRVREVLMKSLERISVMQLVECTDEENTTCWKQYTHHRNCPLWTRSLQFKAFSKTFPKRARASEWQRP
jgi:hypothetical protein